MLMLVEMDYLPAWIPIIVLTREFVVSGYRLIAVEKGGKVIAASIWGKIKTCTQMIAIILMFLTTKPYFGIYVWSKNRARDIASSAFTYYQEILL